MTYNINRVSTDNKVSGVVTGYASMFHHIDLQGDVMTPGAFTGCIQKWKTGNIPIPILWQHHHDKVIGVVKDMKEDAQGLWVAMDLCLEVQQAQEAYALIQQKGINALSIGFSVQGSHLSPDKQHRVLTQVNLKEISVVTFPANPRARLT